MIRTTASVRKASAVAGVAGLLALAGCSGTADAEEKAPQDTGSSSGTAEGSGDYADGTYTADGSYQTPETVEKITVTVTLKDEKVTEVEVTGDPQAPETKNFQGQFVAGIDDQVVGKSLDEITVDRVAGSSLTSGGFNQAIESIKEQAAA